ncbi:MAG: GumC family protein [Acidobacteria bacterium]|nr:GumC family protein [Acidobacteriota bacterium]
MQKGPLSFRYILTILFARRALILTITSLVFIIAVFGSFLIPPTYESTVKILLRRERTEPVVSSEAEPAQPYVSAEVSETEMNSEIELLTGRLILEKVVQESGLAKDSGNGGLSFGKWFDRSYRKLHDQPPANKVDQAVQSLKLDLQVTPIKKSSVVQVSYRASNPEVAARVLNALSQAYIDQHLQLRQAANAVAFYEEQTEALRQKLQEVETDLKRFEADKGLVSVAEQEHLALQKLTDFQAQLDVARVEMKGAEERAATLNALLTTQPEQITKETRTKYNEGLDLLRQKLGELKLRRTELRQKYQPESRVVREVEEQVATVKQYLDQIENQPAQEVAQGLNELHVTLKSDVLRTRAEVAMQRERVKALSGVVGSYKSGLRAYRENSYEQRSLSRMRDVIEQAYLAYVKKTEEARLSQALDQRRIVNVNIAEPAAPNYQPVSPKPFLNGVLGLAVGLFCSVATAFGLEYFEHPVRSEEIIERQLSLNVLAALPEEGVNGGYANHVH